MRALRTPAWVLTLLFVFLPTAHAKTIYAYVANNESDTISVINTKTNKVVKTISMDDSPLLSLAINPAGSFLYVCGGNNIYVVSTSTNSIVDIIGGDFYDIVFTLNGKTAYMTTVSGSAYIYALNTKTKKLKAISVGGSAYELAITPDGKFLYVVLVNPAPGPSAVAVISTATNQVVTNIPLGDLGGSVPVSIAISPVGSTAYVMYSPPPPQPQDPSGVLVIDTASNTVTNNIGLIGLASPVFSGTVSPNGQWLYVAADAVLVIDTSTQTWTNTIPPNGTGAVDVAFTPDGAFAYAAQSSTLVGVIDVATQTVTGGIVVGEFPVGVVMGKR